MTLILHTQQIMLSIPKCLSLAKEETSTNNVSLKNPQTYRKQKNRKHFMLIVQYMRVDKKNQMKTQKLDSALLSYPSLKKGMHVNKIHLKSSKMIPRQDGLGDETASQHNLSKSKSKTPSLDLVLETLSFCLSFTICYLAFNHCDQQRFVG